MALAISVPTQIEVGANIVVTGSGATHGGGCTLQIYAEEGDGGITVTSLALTADGSGNLTTAGVCAFSANKEGHVDYVLTDTTAATSVNGRTQVVQVG